MSCEIIAFDNPCLVSVKQFTYNGPRSFGEKGRVGSLSPGSPARGRCPPSRPRSWWADISRAAGRAGEVAGQRRPPAAAAPASAGWAPARPCAHRSSKVAAARASLPCAGQTALSSAENPQTFGRGVPVVERRGRADGCLPIPGYLG